MGPPGPIPMGYLPSEVKDSAEPVAVENNAESSNASLSQESQSPAPPQRNKSPPQQVPVKNQTELVDAAEKKGESRPNTEAMRKKSGESTNVADEALRKSSNGENKTAKEPLVNFIPIKVERSRPESPKPKANSRATSQE